MLVSSTENNKRDCEFSEDTVAYIYGELEDSKKANFSLHLENCSDCAAALSSFSSIHTSIQNWKTAKFDHLSSPVIEIPWSSEHNENKASVSESWLANLYGIFSFPRRLGQIGAFAAILICAGLGYFILNSYTSDNALTGTSDNSIVNNVLSTPKAEVAKIENFNSNPDKERDNEESVITESNEQEIKTPVLKEPSINKEIAPVKISDKTANKNIIQKSAVRNSNRIHKTPKSENNFSNENYGSVPKLNNLPDEADDEVLRLADLFDEIDTR